MTARVLIVDDEQNIRRMLRALLEQDAYEVHDIGNSAAAVRAVDEVAPDVVLLDLVMPPGPDGLETLERLRAADRHLVVIMMSGKATLADAVRATRLGAFQFLEKPLTPEGVLVAVSAGLDLARTREENRHLRSALEQHHAIVGASDAVETLRAEIARVATTPARVLITGESGTGKELVAREIHRQSPRAEQPLVTVNCAAIPGDLVESEMFGHEKGAFTGAHERRRGKFELAHRGTLFLDEVGDLGANAQAKLLRVLETGRLQRVGGERTIDVDVRVVSATNRNLESGVKSGRFREDLYYRLNVVPIHVPPLRERREDIPELAEHFAALVGTRFGRAPATLTEAALSQLRTYSWPGNVRELANAIERLSILSGPQPIESDAVRAVLGSDAADPPSEPKRALSEALEDYERELIESALSATGGNVADAARRLDTDRANLYRRMRRLGIDRRSEGDR